ncbi:MAG TPA: hypothetical protein VHY79_12585, partial [Rhizomicrobium sp.]|nr:hypothetical protein [Rhizomicrobium sp.]
MWQNSTDLLSAGPARSVRIALMCSVAAASVALSAAASDAKAWTFTNFDPPNAVATWPASINHGAIAGSYQVSSGVYHGFVRAANGTVTSFDPTGSAGTHATGINKAGTIAGYYQDSGGVNHGFVMAA